MCVVLRQGNLISAYDDKHETCFVLSRFSRFSLKETSLLENENRTKEKEKEKEKKKKT